MDLIINRKSEIQYIRKMKLKIVQADKRGQIVIPKNIRRELDIEEGSPFIIYTNKRKIILEKIEVPTK